MRQQLAGIALAAVTSGAALAQSVPAPDPPAVAEVRALMMDRLSDPVSAQIIVTKGPWTEDARVLGDHVNGVWYCAKINAKNAYGGYTGFANYLLVDGPGARNLVWPYSEYGMFPIDRVPERMCRPAVPAPAPAPAAATP